MQKAISSEKYKKFTQWLNAAREERGMTMRELAGILGVPHQFVGKVEAGDRRLDVFEYVQYCQALGVNPEDGLAELY